MVIYIYFSFQSCRSYSWMHYIFCNNCPVPEELKTFETGDQVLNFASVAHAVYRHYSIHSPY